jgi:hypothetical protein
MLAMRFASSFFSLVMLLTMPFLFVSCATTADTDIPVPEGYEVVRLPIMDGAILKPKGWYFRHFGTQNSYVYRITKEDSSETNGFLTGFSITIAPEVSKVTHQKPSEYANTVLRDYPKLAIVSKGSGCTYDSGQGSAEQQEWIVDQRVNVFGSNIVCRVGITTMAVDRIDLLVVIVFGTPPERMGDKQANL